MTVIATQCDGMAGAMPSKANRGGRIKRFAERTRIVPRIVGEATTLSHGDINYRGNRAIERLQSKRPSPRAQSVEHSTICEIGECGVSCPGIGASASTFVHGAAHAIDLTKAKPASGSCNSLTAPNCTQQHT